MLRHTFSLALVCIALQAGAVTVRPARCPTNKIAPHKRYIGWYEARNQQIDARTLGAFYDLLVPEGLQNQINDPSGLQESPQNDPEDCGEIEDYDENDLSALTATGNRRLFEANRFFFGGNHYRPQRPNKYPVIPTTTIRPRPPAYAPQRPPQGGYFGQNGYRPPIQQNPSVYVKPVHEDNQERPQSAYRPSGIVGVPLGHIVGMNSIVPSEPPSTKRPRPRPPPRQHVPNSADLNQFHTRRERPRTINNNSVLGSFVDLLFK